MMIKKILDGFFNFEVRYKRLILSLIIICTIPFAYFFTHPTYKSSLDIYFEDHDPAWVYYQDFQRTFGNDEFILLTFGGKEVYSKEVLDIIRDITAELKEIEQVQMVLSLTEMVMPETSSEAIEFKRIIPATMAKEHISKLREFVAENEHIRERMVSSDGLTTAIIVEINSILEHDKKSKLIEDIIQSAKEANAGRLEMHYAGGPIIETQITENLIADNMKFIPISAVLVTIISFALIKNLFLSLITLINVLIISVWGVGLMLMNGHSINHFTVIVGPVIIAISVADSIHIITHFQQNLLNENKGYLSHLIHTLKVLWVPCFFTTVTTVIGYFSLMTTNVKMANVVGLYMGIGVILALFMSYLILPAALVLLNKYIIKGEKNRKIAAAHPKRSLIGKFDVIELIVRCCAILTGRYYKLVGVVFIVAVIVGGLGLARVSYKTDFTTYLDDDHPMVQNIKEVISKIPNLTTIEVVIEAKSEQHDFTNPESLKFIERVGSEILAKLPESVPTSLSILNYIKTTHKAFNKNNQVFYAIPKNRMDIIDYYELAEPAILERYLSPDYRSARISFTASHGNTEVLNKIETLLDDIILRKEARSQFEYKLPGITSMYTKLDRNLKSSQIKSFATAFVLIFFCMFIVCRDIKLTILSMIPNLFPILATFALMGWLGIYLEASSIMIASITMGLAVDDTIHFITWYRRHREVGYNVFEALEKTYHDTGKAIILTSIILITGFGVCAFGSVKPIVTFGLLCSFSITMALVGDLIFLPVILIFAQKTADLTANVKANVKANIKKLQPKSRDSIDKAV